MVFFFSLALALCCCSGKGADSFQRTLTHGAVMARWLKEDGFLFVDLWAAALVSGGGVAVDGGAGGCGGEWRRGSCSGYRRAGFWLMATRP